MKVLLLLRLCACDPTVVKGETGEPVGPEESGVPDDSGETSESGAETGETGDSGEPDCVPADELCDGLDNDCDGEVDEDLTVTRYQDADADGFGDPATTSQRCEETEDGWVQDATDCDDGDDEVFPDSHATETPGDGVDTDCDGLDACTDLDCDGLPDLLITGFSDDGDYEVQSYLYGQGDGWRSAEQIDSEGVEGALVADLDQDGYQDIVLAQYSDGATREIDSVLFWGGPDGFSEGTHFPTLGAMDVIADDLDGDGWLELIFANYRSDSAWAVDSQVYWGSSRGFDPDQRSDLPTRGARQVLAEDLNGDDLPELIFCNLQEEGGSTVTTSSVYWAQVDGYDEDDVTDLPTIGCRAVLAEDLDGDDWPDLVFANYYDAEENSYDLDSYVYWGSEDGFDADQVTSLPTTGAIDAARSDVDGDGDLDLIFAGSAAGDGSDTAETRIFWSTAGSFSSTRYDALETTGAIDLLVEDLSGDGYPELVVARVAVSGDYELDSYVFWGSSVGWSEDARLDLPTTGGYDVAAADADGDGHPDLVFSSYTGSTGPRAAASLYPGLADDEHGTSWSPSDRTELDCVDTRSPPIWVGVR